MHCAASAISLPIFQFAICLPITPLIFLGVPSSKQVTLQSAKLNYLNQVNGSTPEKQVNTHSSLFYTTVPLSCMRYDLANVRVNFFRYWILSKWLFTTLSTRFPHDVLLGNGSFVLVFGQTRRMSQKSVRNLKPAADKILVYSSGSQLQYQKPTAQQRHIYMQVPCNTKFADILTNTIQYGPGPCCIVFV